MAAEIVTLLSTIRQPVGQLGASAVRLVIDQIARDPTGEVPDVVLQPESVIRATG
jgi:DNA-binding LacI/PurR family transcriptional regulator